MAKKKEMSVEEARKKLVSVSANEQRLKRGDFTLTNGTANERTKIAEYEAEAPLAFREDAIRLVVTTVEEFQTNATGGDQETFNLSNNIISTANTTDFVLFESGNRVQEDSVDYAADSFTYTDNGTGNYLHACYVARDPVQLEIEKSAPRAQGKVSEVLYDDVTSILHERNQNKEPPRMDFSGDPPLTPVVPRKWTIEVYADGPYPVEWDDSSETNSQGSTAVNAVVSLPVNRSKQEIPNLASAVKKDIIQ